MLSFAFTSPDKDDFTTTTTVMAVDGEHANGNANSGLLGGVFSKPAWMSSATSRVPLSVRIRNIFTVKSLVGWPPEEATRETAWLDGLRGVAAFLVMIYHFGLALYSPLFYETPYGGINIVEGELQGEPHNEFWRLPFFRLWMDSGHAQVSVFFVLSGLVLSWGPLGSIKNGQLEKFAQSMGSATFRRWIRLYFPCFAVALWEALEIEVGLRTHPGKGPRPIFSLLWDYLLADEHFSNPLDIKRTGLSALHGYDWTMWTIPFEFSGSLLVFLLCLAICRFRSFYKKAIVIGIISAWACYHAEWTWWLFSAGMFIANYIRHVGGFKGIQEKATWWSNVTWSCVFVVGLLLAGSPEPSEYFTRPGYQWLDEWVPREWKPVEGGGRFWWCWAGILIVLSTCHLSAARKVFNWAFMRYLGKVSYMLYLTHRITLNLVGEGWKHFLFRLAGRNLFVDDVPNGSSGLWSHALSTFLLYVLFMGFICPLSIIVAHWATVWIDEPSTNFAKTVDQWFLKGGDSQGPSKSISNGSILPSHNSAPGLERQETGTVGGLRRPEEFEEYREEDHLAAPGHFEMTEMAPRPEDDHPSRSQMPHPKDLV